MSDQDWTAMAAAYVLGSLDPDETARFEARMADDPALVREVAELGEIPVAILDRLPQRLPSPDLKTRILERAVSTPQPDSIETASERAVTPLPTPSPREAPQAVGRLGWLALAASLAGLVWLGTENRRLATEAASLRDMSASLRAELSTAEAARARLDSLSALLSGPDVRSATLTSEGEPTLRLLFDPSRRSLLIAASDLPAPAAGRTYQLWGIAEGEAPVSLGTFETDADGSALVLRTVDAGADYDLSAVTDEPDGGSPQPTTTPFLVGSWSVGPE